MRQKKLKHVDENLMNELGVITEIEKLDLKDYEKVHLEIGSGKGNFITTLALDNKDELFIALEKNISVCYRIIEKKNELNLENLIVVLGDSINLLEYLDKNSVDIIYLNFSDPWPKARHHKRRLTYQPFLNVYKDLLKTNGLIQLRTDHLDFFNDSLEYFEKNFKKESVDYDYKSDKYFTEYEAKKRKKWKINQYRGRNLK